jgi:multicomponent Na+:H+ antiporter subunit E
MTKVFNFLFRLLVWFLLTANFSLINIGLGVAIALVLPNGFRIKGSAKEWLLAIAKIGWSVPLAYIEAIQMMLKPHKKQEIIVQEIKPNRCPELVFMDIFQITFTPKTIVTNYDPEQGYAVHRVRPED